MAPVEKLDELIQSMQALKAPGVSKPKVDAITALCRENIQSEGLLVQKIYSAFSKAAPNYKLGVVYVVDSVTRDWVNQTRKQGQGSTGPPEDGTYQAGIQKMSEIIPRIMKQLYNVAPESQEEKIQKLLSIWTSHGTFPAAVLKSIEQEWQTVKGSKSKPAPAPCKKPAIPKDAASYPNQRPLRPTVDVRSITPAGEPPAHVLSSLGLKPEEPKPPADISAILAGLANPPREQAKPAAPPQPQYPPPASKFPSQPTPQPAPQLAPPIPQLNAASGGNNSAINALQFLMNSNTAAPPQPAQPAAPPALPQIPATGQNGAPNINSQLQLQLLQALMQSGGQLPPEQLAQVMVALGLGGQQPPVAAAPPQQPAVPQHASQGLNGYGDPRDAHYSRDSDFDPRRRQDSDYSRNRDRSRSPDYRRGRISPPNRRDSPTYGAYDPNNVQRGSDDRGRGKRGGRGRNDYRQRSPPRGRGASPDDNTPVNNLAPKWIDHDSSLPPDHIRVLSRTLFVGGVGASEPELKNIFARFGEVQSCIVNMDKRHAFVKMFDRKSAVAARIGMEHEKDADILAKVRSTRWGVGFGPRECSDYSSGISIIPIDRLTDADRKWILSAEYGGTGGIPLESGMVVEEPDIEIGQGVSSKAISRRVGPDYTGRPERGGHGGRGGFRGGHSDRGRGGRGGHHADRGPRHQHQPQAPRGPEPDTVGVPPPVPGFGFQLPGMN